jgi:hypothetical protein
MKNFYYKNRLANQNKTAKNNIIWAVDYTELDLKHQGKLQVFICIDLFAY